MSPSDDSLPAQGTCPTCGATDCGHFPRVDSLPAQVRRFARWMFTAAGARLERDKFGSWVVRASGDQYATIGGWIEQLKAFQEVPQ